jgi:hypothetical protein
MADRTGGRWPRGWTTRYRVTIYDDGEPRLGAGFDLGFLCVHMEAEWHLGDVAPLDDAIIHGKRPDLADSKNAEHLVLAISAPHKLR